MPATRARQRRGSGAPRGGAPQPASRPRHLRTVSGDDLVGGFRVSDRSDDWFRDPAPQYQGGRPAGSGGGYSGRGSPGRGRRWLRPRRILAIIALVVVVVLVLTGVGYF